MIMVFPDLPETPFYLKVLRHVQDIMGLSSDVQDGEGRELPLQG